jgi:hypothetical protein
LGDRKGEWRLQLFGPTNPVKRKVNADKFFTDLSEAQRRYIAW